MRRIGVFPIWLAALGIVAVALYLLTTHRAAPQAPDTDATDTPEARQFALEQKHLDAARHRIAVGAMGETPPIAVRAAPLSAASSGAMDVEPAPALPDGYSYTNAPTTMERGMYRAPATPSAEPPTDGADWLVADGLTTTVPYATDGLQRDWVFGWLRLADGTKAHVASNALRSLGIDILAQSGRLLRAKLPVDEGRLAQAERLDAVSAIGIMPAEHKVPAGFAAKVNAAPTQQVPVLITLMDGDAEGRWRRTLQQLGAVVGRFDADIRAYAANVDADVLDAITKADFVLAVEPMRLYQPTHDTAVPAVGADAVRFHTQVAGRFRGTTGASIPIGVMDTGLNTNHLDIATHRRSICGANFAGWAGQRTEDADLWMDVNGHGTHVTGTILGNGFIEPGYAGLAPGVAHIRFAKVLSRYGFGWTSDILRGMDFLAESSTCGGANESAKPLIVNMSLSASSRVWRGRSSAERKLDAVVWGQRQLYVVAQSNEGISGLSNYGSAKNSLSVGATDDSGNLASFSSWGPTFDGRLAPQVVAPGVEVYSARGKGERATYRALSGTSMASPGAAGTAALLMDAVPGYREQPALTRARLMASAIKPDAWLDAPDAFAATNSVGPGNLQFQYGLGKASARASVLQRAEADGWENHAALLTLDGDSYGYRDIIVPEGTNRLDIVLSWDEPPSETIANAVLNDLDLWLDTDADCREVACGEYASRSRRDNVEWIIVRNPAPGIHRVRVVPHRIYATPPRAALAWTLVRGASTPTVALTVDEMRPITGHRFRIGLSLAVDAYIAAGVQLAFESCRYEDTLCNPNNVRASLVTTEDSDAPRWRRSAWQNARGWAIQLGEVGVGERQRVELDMTMPPGIPSAPRLGLMASAWNARPAFASVTLPASTSDDEAAQEPPAQASSPHNDDFADAETLSGATGSVAADLLAATFEPGEPFPEGGRRFLRPLGSVWYRWRAPTSGTVHFRTSAPLDTRSKRYFSPSDVLPVVDVLQGNSLAALAQLAPSAGSASFFAERRANYWIRVKTPPSVAPAPFTLRWSRGPRPANDDFDGAMLLEGGEGSVSSHNHGATLEPGEQVGNFLTATVWFRWTASQDGTFTFEADGSDAVTLVFVGTSVESLRLVSDKPWRRAHVSVRGGTEYHIAVAAEGGNSNPGAGGDFNLEWRSISHRPWSDHHYFADATELTSASGSTSVSAGRWVEPGEPSESGVRTRWWRWTAPASGRFVWRLIGNDELKVAVFTPTDTEDSGVTSPGDLRLVATAGQWAAVKELAFDATEGQRYWISVGFHTGDSAAFSWGSSATLEWGESPANDTLAQRAALAGRSGSMTVSNRWGTLEDGEAGVALGHSSLWWALPPDISGWHRFRVDAPSATLAIYRVRDTGFEGLQLVVRSHGWRSPDAENTVSVLFDATAGEHYVIRLGTEGETSGSESTLEWEPADAPTWLRYLGRLQTAALGLEDEDPDALLTATMSFENRGEALYLASPRGLHMLRRNADDGTIGQVRVLAMERPNALLWDAERTQLYAHVNCAWRQLTPRNATRLNFRDEGVLQVLDAETTPCSVRTSFLDADGTFLYHGHTSGLDVLAVGETALTHVQRIEVDDLQDALLAPDGASVFTSTGSTLSTFIRDPSSGLLTAAGETNLMRETKAIALDKEGALLFAVAENGSVDAYDVSELANPRHSDALGAFGNATWPNVNGECLLAAARPDRKAVDAFCRNSAFSVAMRDTDGLQATDYLANWESNRFNIYVPKFRSTALAISPDGRHAYVYAYSFSDGGGNILFFERIGSSVPAPLP